MILIRIAEKIYVVQTIGQLGNFHIFLPVFCTDLVPQFYKKCYDGKFCDNWRPLAVVDCGVTSNPVACFPHIKCPYADALKKNSKLNAERHINIVFIITSFIEFHEGKAFCKLDEHLEMPSKWNTVEK